jgi:cytidylate kinase
MSIIAISRGTRSGGLELADRLSDRLGYNTLSREEVIAESARKFNVMGEFLQVRLDKTPSLWQKFTNDYQRYICFIQCALLEAAEQDDVIYHGHAGQFLLKGLPSVLKLRIEAPLEYRARAVMAELQSDHDEAVKYIEKVDDERKRWVKMVYNQDWCDPSLYDLCVNLQNMSMDNICDVVAMVVEHDDFKTSEDSVKRLKNLALQRNVEAALSSDDKIWGSGHQVAVTAHDGVVSLRGTVKSNELRGLIVDTTSMVKGVVDCRSEITLLSDALR